MKKIDTMNNLIRFLLYKKPTGIYTGRHGDSEISKYLTDSMIIKVSKIIEDNDIT